MRKTKENTEITKQKILSSALIIFAKEGYYSSTLDDIASLAEITKTPIFWHFSNKATLFNAVILEAAKEIKVILNEAFTPEVTPIERIYNSVKIVLTRSEKIHSINCLLNHILKYPSSIDQLQEGKGIITEIFKNYLQELQDTIQEGLDQGDFESSVSAQFLTQSLYAYTWGYFTYTLQSNIEKMNEDSENNLFNMIHHMLGFTPSDDMKISQQNIFSDISLFSNKTNLQEPTNTAL